MSFRNIPEYNGQVNLGGYRSFLYVPVQWVQQVPGHGGSYNIVQDITLHPGRLWLKGYNTLHTLGFTEVQKTVRGVPVYEQRFRAFVPRDVPDLTALFRFMAHHRYLVLGTNNEGLTRLGGILANGMRFTWAFDSARIDGRNVKGYAIEFRVEAWDAAPFYQATAQAEDCSGLDIGLLEDLLAAIESKHC